MDNPKAPNVLRDWDSIDMFLFTNGQEFSPPRKYHLKTEELNVWDMTINFLARSQFGSLHSKIELYTLDGKKINTPLDLVNEAAYVAVKPPDIFVQSGYEKYLLKASRSREKRHERLNNSEIANKEINKDQIPNDIAIINNDKIIDDGLSLDTEIEYLVVDNNTFTQSQKNAESLPQIETTTIYPKAEKPEIQKNKPGGNTRNTILKKICPNSKRKEEEHNINKKRTTSFPKNLIKCSNNSKRIVISPNNRNILKTNVLEPHITNIKTAENITEGTEKNNQLRNYPMTKNLPDISVLSDVYKNTESDIQSVFIDADRKTALLSNVQKTLPHVSENIVELGETPKIYSKVNKAMSQGSASNLSDIQAPYNVNQPGTLNINLKIDLKGCRVLKTDEENHANKFKTYVTLIKPEKASQVNDDVRLNRETSNFVDDALPPEDSVESVISKTCKDKFADNITNLVVHCKCNIFESDNNTSSPNRFKDNNHCLILIPTEKIDKFLPRGDLEIRRVSDKEIQDLLKSCIRVPVPPDSEIVYDKKPENVTKQKESISQNPPKKPFCGNIVQLKSQGDIIQPTFTNELNKTKIKIDNFAQTDWCNILVQAKCHEDGRYTFHLPPLHLLAHYNLL